MTDRPNLRDECVRVDDAMTDVLEGTAPEALYDHIAECDRCRDARHDADDAAEIVADSGIDYVHPEDFDERIERALDGPGEGTEDLDEDERRSDEGSDAGPHLTGGALAAVTDRGGQAATADPIPRPPRRRADVTVLDHLRRPRNTLAVGLVGAAVVAATVALVVRPSDDVTTTSAKHPWTGKVGKISRAAGGEGGLSICEETCQPAVSGATIPAGARLETDDRTRAYVELEDGTRLALDRRTKLAFDGDRDRAARLETGAIVAEVQKREGSQVVIDVPLGRVEVIGTKLAVRTTDGATAVDVSRGEVRVVDKQERAVSVRAGEEGRLYEGSPPYATAAPSLGEALSWSEGADDETVAVRGLGELKAKKPGEDDDPDDQRIRGFGDECAVDDPQWREDGGGERSEDAGSPTGEAATDQPDDDDRAGAEHAGCDPVPRRGSESEQRPHRQIRRVERRVGGRRLDATAVLQHERVDVTASIGEQSGLLGVVEVVGEPEGQLPVPAVHRPQPEAEPGHSHERQLPCEPRCGRAADSICDPRPRHGEGGHSSSGKRPVQLPRSQSVDGVTPAVPSTAATSEISPSVIRAAPAAQRCRPSRRRSRSPDTGASSAYPASPSHRSLSTKCTVAVAAAYADQMASSSATTAWSSGTFRTGGPRMSRRRPSRSSAAANGSSTSDV